MDEGQWVFDEWAHPIGRHGIKESFPLNKLPMSDGSLAKSKGKSLTEGQGLFSRIGLISRCDNV
jgi:hypothetical protein